MGSVDFNVHTFDAYLVPFAARARASGVGNGLFTLDFNACQRANGDVAPNARAVVSMQTWLRDRGNGSGQDTSPSHALRFTVTP